MTAMNRFLKTTAGLAFAALCFAACQDKEDDLLPDRVPFPVTDITNVMIPDISITPGMTLTVPGEGFDIGDTGIALISSDGTSVAAGEVSVDEKMTAVTFVIPEDCATGAYTVELTRSDGSVITLGNMDVTDRIALNDVSASETYDLNSWITIRGTGFYQGDSVVVTDFYGSYTQETVVSDVTVDGGSIRFESPLDVTGEVTVQLKRGIILADLPGFVIGELLPEITGVVIPDVSVTPGMTLTVSANDLATTDKSIVLEKDGAETEMTGVTLTDESIRFTIPETVPAGTYALNINRADNTVFTLEAELDIVTEIEIGNAAPAQEKTPINEPFRINGSGFYPGDSFRFVCEDKGISEIVDSRLEEDPEGNITVAVLTPPADFIGEAAILVVRGIVETEIATVNIVDEIGNVVIPTFSIVPGQTVTIAATNVKAEDEFVLVPLSGGSEVTPEKVSSDAGGYTMTIADGTVAGSYTLRSGRTGQDLGTLTVSDVIEFTGLAQSDDVFIKGSGHDVTFSTTASAKTFAPGDRVSITDGASGTVTEDEIELSEDNTTFTVTVPGSAEGELSVKIIRGSKEATIGSVNLIDEVKIGDYHEGGIVVWLDPENPAHGIAMNLFHGHATQRNVGVLHDRRTAFGHEGVDHGTDPEEYQNILMGAVCTQMIFDAEEKAGYDPTEPVIDAEEWDGPGLSAARICADLVTQDKYTGKQYDDWYLPTIKLLNYVYPMRKDLNVAFDREGGESFAGTGYVYQYGSESGTAGYDARDGSANYISSNQSLVDPDNGLNQARYQSFTDAGANGWYNKTDPYYYVRAARSF